MIAQFKTHKTAYFLIILISAIIVASLFSNPPIPQDAAYHLFSDQRTAWLIPNIWNVFSNILFFAVGLSGVYKTVSGKSFVMHAENRVNYLFLFSATSLVALGSGYYHLNPDNHSLIWDRLPMSIAFMSLFSIIIAEFISAKAGKILLLPLVFAGITSVMYWHLTESRGLGDLRFYLLVQFMPVVLIPVIISFFSSQFTHTLAYWLLLLSYVIAKLLEHFDSEIYQLLGFISGHSLKHIAVAIGMYILLAAYNNRVSVNPAAQNHERI